MNSGVGHVIRTRRTLKVLGDETQPWPPADASFRQEIVELMEMGACAPYHYPCDASHQQGEMNSPAPWRYYAVDSANCRMLIGKLKGLDEPIGKIGAMLAVADGMIVATWLPDPPATPLAPGDLFAPTLRNMEHIAAASAGIQNILLGATEKGIHNYWSSGGAVLRGNAAYAWLGIPLDEILLGAIFLFPQQTNSADTKPGANRELKGQSERWSCWATFG